MMESFINVFLDSPTLLISIIVFFLCVIIGFFSDQYLKKNSGFNKITDNKIEDNKKEVQEEVKEVLEPSSQTVVNNDIKETAPLIDNMFENFVSDSIYPPQNDLQDINANQNININQNTDDSYINNDNNFNNMF